MSNEEKSPLDMHAKLIATVEALREQGVKFEDTPVLYKWTYTDLPEIEFSLLIKLKEEENPTGVVH